MTDLDVGVGGGDYDTVPHSDYGVDLFRPSKLSIPYFVQCDAEHLPFLDSQFDIVYAHNLLEHVPNPWMTLRELARVSRIVLIVQDKIWSMCSYSTYDHFWFQLPGFRFIPFPRTRPGRIFAKAMKIFVNSIGKFAQRIHFTVWYPYFDTLFLRPHYYFSYSRADGLRSRPPPPIRDRLPW